MGKDCFPEKNGGKVTYREMYSGLQMLEEKIDRHHNEVVEQINLRIDDANCKTGVVDEKLENHRKNEKVIVAIITTIAVVLPITLRFLPELLK